MKPTLLRHSALLFLFLLPACAGVRPERTREQLLEQRKKIDARYVEQSSALIQRLVERAKKRYDESQQQKENPPTLDLLVISGGGDWGAFGAGFLKGWSTIQGSMARPEFDAVTGVSTGALIAPFAFMNNEASTNTIVKLYRNPQSDWVKKRWPIYFLPSNASFATIPGLERELRERVDTNVMNRIAEIGKTGRSLIVNTTDLDDGGMCVWDVTVEAQRGDLERVHRILLASAGIPAAFPFREIDDSLYVDGAVTANILYGGRIAEKQSFPAVWKAAYPEIPIPKIRYWIIFNDQIRSLPQVTSPTWPAIVERSVAMSTRAATVTSIRHLFAQAEISQLKRGATVEIRYVAIPDDFIVPKPGVFIKETMEALADLGEKMGSDPISWKTESP